MLKLRPFDDNKGFTIVEFLLVMAIVSIVTTIIYPVISDTAERIDNVRCRNNLMNVGEAIYVYAREHDGDFPDSLEKLYREEYIANEKYMDCPNSKEIGTYKDSDYFYTTALTAKDPSTTILLQDNPSNHKKRINFLRIDGKVSWQKKQDNKS